MTTYVRLKASSLIRKHSFIDSWFPFRYSLDIYSGCEYNCPYCRANWEKKKIIIKENLKDLLTKETKHLHPSAGSAIGIGGGFNDIFSPINDQTKHTDYVVSQLIKNHHLPLILTQNPNYLLRKEKWQQWGHNSLSNINKLNKPSKKNNQEKRNDPIIIVSFSSLEFRENVQNHHSDSPSPTPPSNDEKFKAMKQLIEQGFRVGALIMPIIPSSDDPKTLESLFLRFKRIKTHFVMYDTIDLAGLSRLTQEGWIKNLSSDHSSYSLASNWQQYQIKIKAQCYKYSLKHQCFPCIPFSFVRDFLCLKDQVTVALSQVYYLEKLHYTQKEFSTAIKPKKVREALKFSAYSINQISEKKFEQYLKNDQLSALSGIGDYLSLIISQMALNKNFSFYEKNIKELGFHFQEPYQ